MRFMAITMIYYSFLNYNLRQNRIITTKPLIPTRDYTCHNDIVISLPEILVLKKDELKN